MSETKTMELVDLLDKINETAPKSCRTCRHMATHRGCKNPGDSDYCLIKSNYNTETRKFEDDPNDTDFKNWEPGNWLRDLQAAEETGRSIVIGDQGEAEVSTKSTPKAVSKNLHYVAEQCGYMVGNLRKIDSQLALDVYTGDANCRLLWDADTEKLLAIWYLNDKGEPVRKQWPRF